MPLCGVSLTEPRGISYYWGQDLDGEPDTLWGLEGYTDAAGFFEGHPASDVFKREMAKVDNEKLLAQDYDLKHYDFAGGWLKRPDDLAKDSNQLHVAVLHFFASKGQRDKLISRLVDLAETARKEGPAVSSCGVLKEVNHADIATLWVRYVGLKRPGFVYFVILYPHAYPLLPDGDLMTAIHRTNTPSDFASFQPSDAYRKAIDELQAAGAVERTELHQSRTFIGHLDNKPLCEQ